MDIHLQAKLLRVLQESEVDLLGGKAPISIDVRIVATTNADLKTRIQEKTFRDDLYYRLNVIPIKIPPLRERGGDISLLIEYFLKKYSQINERPQPEITEETISMLTSYPWPGNVRELENVMERAALVCSDRIIRPENLYLDRNDGKELTVSQEKAPVSVASSVNTLRDMEKTLIFDTLSRVNGNKVKASKILGISVRTIRNKLHEYGDTLHSNTP